MEQTTGPGVLQTQRVLPFSPETIYAAFADPVRLARWWGPAGFSNRFEVFEFHEGGSWQFVMQGPDGKHYPNRSTFRTLEPGRKVVVQHLSAPHFTLTVELQPDVAGALLRWVQAFDDPKVAAAVEHIVVPSNEQNLDRLHAELERRG